MAKTDKISQTTDNKNCPYCNLCITLAYATQARLFFRPTHTYRLIKIVWPPCEFSNSETPQFSFRQTLCMWRNNTNGGRGSHIRQSWWSYLSCRQSLATHMTRQNACNVLVHVPTSEWRHQSSTAAQHNNYSQSTGVDRTSLLQIAVHIPGSKQRQHAWCIRLHPQAHKHTHKTLAAVPRSIYG